MNRNRAGRRDRGASKGDIEKQREKYG